jgi:hypothetical protein
MTHPAALIVFAASAPATWLVQAAADPGGKLDLQSLIGTTVTPAIVILLLLFGKLRMESEVKRLERDLAAERKERLDLLETVTTKVIPALTKSTLVLEKMVPTVEADITYRRTAHGDG